VLSAESLARGWGHAVVLPDIDTARLATTETALAEPARVLALGGVSVEADVQALAADYGFEAAVGLPTPQREQGA
jgi:hypothetical protein